MIPKDAAIEVLLTAKAGSFTWSFPELAVISARPRLKVYLIHFATRWAVFRGAKFI